MNKEIAIMTKNAVELKSRNRKYMKKSKVFTITITGSLVTVE